MNDLNPFEKEIKLTYRLPSPHPAFFNRLETRLLAGQSNPEGKARSIFHLQRSWAYGMAVFFMISALVFSIGPSTVLAQIQAVFGFVPGAGLVQTSLPFRQLAEPVSDTKEGITLTIQSAFLSTDRTIITYTLSDLPTELNPVNFGDPVCSAPDYLILANGSTVEAMGTSSSLAPDGSSVHIIHFSNSSLPPLDQATLVFPCLEGTVQGKGPMNWQIALAFEPAAEDMTVYPATILHSQAKIESPVPDTSQSEGETAVAGIIDGDRQEDMTILAVVEKPEAYWVTWAYPLHVDEDIQINGHLTFSPFDPVLYDSYGKKLPEPNQETQLELWQYEDTLRDQLSEKDRMMFGVTLHTFVVPRTGVAFPVMVKQNVYERSFPEKKEYAEIEFDGTRVQASGEPVEINQEIRLGSVKFELIAIEKNPYGGYSFLFDGTEGKVVQCEIELVDHGTDVSGGNTSQDDPFHFSQTVQFQQIPTGELTVRISRPVVLGNLISFIGSWSPER